MFEIPLSFSLFSPSIDVVFIIAVVYVLIWRIYSDILKNNTQRIFWIDFQLTVIFLALGYVNYAGEHIDVFGIDFSWFAYIIIVQFVVEGVLFFLNPDIFKKMIEKNTSKK